MSFKQNELQSSILRFLKYWLGWGGGGRVGGKPAFIDDCKDEDIFLSLAGIL